MSLTPGDVFAGFTIDRELGAGGMGVVYLARHPRLPRHVALKLLRTDLGSDTSFVARFRREAETVAGLDHPNIVAIDDSGADDGRLWISMRFVDGTTAAEALHAYDTGMPASRAVHIVEKVAAALDFAHRHRVVHRDVKPANILLTGDQDGDDERVFLTDFGVAKAMGEIEAQATALTAAGGVVATLDYAAPEQIEGKQLDGRCDVYALGCVLYKLLTGDIPYPGETLGAKIYARMHRPPPAPAAIVPTLACGFDAVIARALALDPDDRYQTCRELAVAARLALVSAVGGNTTTERMPPPDPDATRTMADPGPGGPVRSSSPNLPMHPKDRASPSHTAPESLPPGPAQLPDPGGAIGVPGPDAVVSRWARTRRRSLSAVGAALLVAAVITGFALWDRGGIAGDARARSLAGAGVATGPAAGTSPSPVTGTTPSTASNPTASTAVSAGSTLVPVAGLPHSAPLPAKVVVASRQYDKKFALYPIDTVTGQVGPAITKPTAYPQNPLISPERGSIIYLQADATGNTVRTVAADGHSDRLLFPRPAGCLQIARPAWNPANTQQLAISCQVDQAGLRSLQLVDLGGKLEATLRTNGLHASDDLSFAPNGRQLTFWAPTSADSGDSRLYTLRTDDTDAEPIAITPAGSHDGDPDFSPDGQQIVFTRFVGSHAQIATVGSDGSAPRVLTTTASNSQGPVFSPDGSQVTYKNDLARAGAPAKDEIWVMTLASPPGTRAVVTGDAGSVAASPAWGNR